MATAADSSNSPRSPAAKPADSGGINSPQARRQAPWAQVVRGGGGDPTEASSVSPVASPELTDASPEKSPADTPPEAAAQPKKPAWNRPTVNGVVEAGPVMGGAVSWPALSESTRPGAKSAGESPKPGPDASVSVPQGAIISQLPQKQASANSHSNSNATPVRQKSMKHRGGNGAGSSGSGPGGVASIRVPAPPPPPLPPPFPVIPYGNMVPPVLEPPVRGSRPLGGFPSQHHGAGDHSSHRSPGRKGNFGGRPRGDGSYHGGRRDQERSRDAHLSPPPFVAPPAGFIPAQPPGSGPFLSPPPIRAFAGPMGFDMPPQFFYVPQLSPESFRGMPIITQPPPPPLYIPVVDASLHPALVQQIEYYFSDANLVKDDFLRSKMDEEGWVPVELIANFPRVKKLTDAVQCTDNVQFILQCLRTSMLVEVQDESIRRRDDWRKWIHTSGRFAADSGSSAPTASTNDSVATSLLNVSLNESATDGASTTKTTDAQVEVAASGLSNELTNQSKPTQEESSPEISSSHT